MIARKYFKTLIFVEFSVSHHLLLTTWYKTPEAGNWGKNKGEKRKKSFMAFPIQLLEYVLCFVTTTMIHIYNIDSSVVICQGSTRSELP